MFFRTLAPETASTTAGNLSSLPEDIIITWSGATFKYYKTRLVNDMCSCMRLYALKASMLGMAIKSGLVLWPDMVKFTKILQWWSCLEENIEANFS